MTDEIPLLLVGICSHGKKTGIKSLQEGCGFTVPGCGRGHVATRDLYEIDPEWVEEQKYLEMMRERAAKARAARLEGRE